jgi:hypothetical protein
MDNDIHPSNIRDKAVKFSSKSKRCFTQRTCLVTQFITADTIELNIWV